MAHAPRHLSSLLLFLLGSTVLTPVHAEVTSVTLTSSGLSEIVEKTDGKSEIPLTFTMDQVSDVLKSLTLIGPDVTGGSLRIDSASATDQIARTLPFDPRKAGDLEHLIAAFPGAEVEINLWDETLRGSIVGLTPSCAAPGSCDTLLVLRKDDGTLIRMPLASEMEVSFKDKGIVETISRGLDAVSRDASGKLRTVWLSIEGKNGKEARDTLISYVIPAPAWKTSWRAELREDGTVGLQAWAVVENATGRDWNEVDLTLTTGSPRNLQAELYASTWKNRERLEAEDPTLQPVPFADTFAMRKTSDEAGAPALMAMAEMADLSPRVQLRETESEARYGFEAPVSLKDGEVLSMPFLGRDVEARRLARYIGGAPRIGVHPNFSLEIKNSGDVRLPGGIVTLQEAGLGYVGDAELPDIHPGETRSIEIGEDRKVTISESVDFQSGEVHLKLENGILTVEESNLRETVYRIEGAAQEPRSLKIDHPISQGWSVETLTGAEASEEITEDGRAFLRHIFDLKPGDSRSLQIVERQPVSSAWALSDIGSEQIEFWKGAKLSEEDRNLLEEIGAMRQQASLFLKQREDLSEERAKVEGDQQRAIELLQALPAEDPGAERFRKAMLDAEDRIAEIDAEDAALKARIEDLEAGLWEGENDAH